MSVPDPKASQSRPQGALPQEIIQMILATKPVLLPAGVELPTTCDRCWLPFIACKCQGFVWSAKRNCTEISLDDLRASVKPAYNGCDRK